MKAVLYARVSSKEQEKEGYSIPAQLKLLKDYACKNDLKITQQFVDVETAKQAFLLSDFTETPGRLFLLPVGCCHKQSTLETSRLSF